MRNSESIRKTIEENELLGENDGEIWDQLQIKARRSNRRSYEQRRLRKFGYSTFLVPCGDNEYELKYIYTGKYYRQNLSKGNRILVRLAYTALLACAVLLFLSSAWIVPLNAVWYVTLPQAVCIPLFALLFKNVVAGILFASKDLSEQEYRSVSTGTKKASIGAVIGCAVEVLGVLSFMVVNDINIYSIETKCAVKYIICVAIMLAIYRIEVHIRYDVIEQKLDIPEEYIRFE